MFRWVSLFCLGLFALARLANAHSLTCEDRMVSELSRPPDDLRNGLVTSKVPLTPDAVLYAYARGAYPMLEDDRGNGHWYNPPRRGLLELAKVKIWRRDEDFIRQAIARGTYRVTMDRAFELVMRKCMAQRRFTPFKDHAENFITERYVEVYTQLHRKGFAHSFEVWSGRRLVAGLYGVYINGVFSGESMFRDESNAVKLAMYALIERLLLGGHKFIDAQENLGLIHKWGGALYDRDEEYRPMLLAEQRRHLPF